MAVLTAKQVRILNNLGPEAKGMSLGTRLQEALSGDVPAGSISGTEIASGAVGTTQLADDGVTTAKIAANAVTTAEIAAGAVGNTDLAADAVTSDKVAAGAIGTTDIASGAVTNAILAANAVNLAKIAAGLFIGIAASDAKTTSREENVAGLSSAIALANSLKTVTNAHAADGAEHFPGSVATPDTVNYPIATADATDLATLLTLSGSLLTAYDAHDADAEGVSPTYHNATEAGDHSLTSAVTPTTLQEAITRLNDLKAKYNAHDADSTAHTTGSTHQEATADAAYGAAIDVTVANVASGDEIVWGIIDSGTGTVTGVTAVAGTGKITFTFSADPQNDAIINYAVFRAAT